MSSAGWEDRRGSRVWCEWRRAVEKLLQWITLLKPSCACCKASHCGKVAHPISVKFSTRRLPLGGVGGLIILLVQWKLTSAKCKNCKRWVRGCKVLQDGSLLPPHYKHLTLFVVLCQCVVQYIFYCTSPSKSRPLRNDSAVTHSFTPSSFAAVLLSTITRTR